jgi:osmotically-inducible protein OsmY
MKNTILFSALVAGLVLAGCNKTRTSSASTDSTPDSTGYATSTTEPTAASPATTTNRDTVGSRIDAATNRVSNSVANASDSMSSAAQGMVGQARMMEWKLSASDIQADLANNNPIVRTKNNAAGTPTGNVDKSVLKSSVESRLAANSDLAALKLDVDADKDGEINLSGKASSAEQVGRAIALALDTDGVNKVTSKIKLDKDAGAANH